MPADKSKAKRTQEKAQESAKAHAAAKPKPDAKAEGPSVNGIPLRRKSVWAIDAESPQFRAARKRDAQALREKADDRDSMQFIDAILAEKDMEKWWK